ncbi:MAG: radical SAM protein [Candidatus Aminicenantes bacterium]|nr:radical SAM protein [Candidatus Aminicenantes bacterium]
MKETFPLDPIIRLKEMEALVLKNGKRAYYRFRPAPYYGGVSTADVVGCSFLCPFCWNYSRNQDPGKSLEFYSPKDVAKTLLEIAGKNRFTRFRISGAEPILGPGSLDHLVEVLQIVFREMPNAVFIVETNGFLLGWKPELISKLRIRNIQVRVSVKGVNEKSFEILSGVDRKYFYYPLIALREMRKESIEAWPALMNLYFTEDIIKKFEGFLEGYGIHAHLERESLEAYGFVLRNMKNRGLKVDGIKPKPRPEAHSRPPGPGDRDRRGGSRGGSRGGGPQRGAPSRGRGGTTGRRSSSPQGSRPPQSRSGSGRTDKK